MFGIATPEEQLAGNTTLVIVTPDWTAFSVLLPNPGTPLNQITIVTLSLSLSLNAGNCESVPGDSTISVTR